MSFNRQQKNLNEQYTFNPPPGYYEIDNNHQIKRAVGFAKSNRFQQKDQIQVPGPGHYNNNQKDATKKRLIQESQKRQSKINEASTSNNIKISSIPSIPKKSATRVYQQLAPGILILHEQENEPASIGPATYNITDKMMYPKPRAHKIAPEHRKRVIQEEPEQILVPTIAQEIRNERRLMYKQNLIKSSTINKSQINPSDLCLEVIILRQKLLRSDQNPPPGYYHNQNFSTFKNEEAKTAENQTLGGKQKRFIEKQVEEVGPGKYKINEQLMYKGGFIGQSPRQMNPTKGQDKLGPGAYIKEQAKPKVQNKSSYPPIFGSGCTRFQSAPKRLGQQSLPGPGSYKIDKRPKKKQKYIKIKRQFLQHKSEITPDLNMQVLADFSTNQGKESAKERRFYPTQKCSSNFVSKVQRFQSDKSIMSSIGPGNYDYKGFQFQSKSFNRNGDGYVGNKMTRFDQTYIRPKVGPGTYNPAYDTVKEKKIINVCL